PGATGQGTLLIGTPVTASLSTTPTFLPQGSGTVTTTLQVNVVRAQDTPVTVQATVPTDARVSILANSFSLAPTTITIGSDSETLTWDLGSLTGGSTQKITWQSSVTGVQPGEAQTVVRGATVQFTVVDVVTSAVNIEPEVNANLQTYANGSLYPVGG